MWSQWESLSCLSMSFRAFPVPWHPKALQTQLCLGSKSVPCLNVVLILIQAREGLGLGYFVFCFQSFWTKKKKALAVFHPNTAAGREGREGEIAWLLARKNADNVRELSWGKYLFLKRRKGGNQRALRGFLLSLRQKGLLQLPTMQIHPPHCGGGLHHSFFMEGEFEAETGSLPGVSAQSSIAGTVFGPRGCCGMVLPFPWLGNTLGLAPAPTRWCSS